MIIFKLLLISHLIGDFFLQPVKLVEKKKNSMRGLLIHVAIYTLLTTFVVIFFGNIWEILLCMAVIFLSHSCIDYYRIKITTKYSNNKVSFWSFIFDQTIHVLILLILSLVIKSDLNRIGNAIYNMHIFNQLNFDKIVNYFLAFSIILTPTSVFIKHLFNYLFNNKEICEKESSDNVGSIIGMLERIVILLLGALGLYSSIALVLTAKSLARFKQLEDKAFAEKYLVGTLISLIIAMLSLLIIN